MFKKNSSDLWYIRAKNIIFAKIKENNTFSLLDKVI